MKPQMNELSVRSKMKRTPATLRGLILAGLLGCLTWSASAAVQVTRFDPPLQISPFSEVPEGLLLNVLGADLDSDGNVDFRLTYGWGGIGAYLNAPVRFGQRVPGPDAIGRGGPVGAVPLNSVIGTNIVSALATNFYAWSPGGTNRDDLTQAFGDHEATIVLANLAVVSHNAPFGGSVPFTNGTFIFPTNVIFLTNIYPPIVSLPIAGGDVVDKDAVMALEFYINGQPHYGYMHFSLDVFGEGVIYGWSYETEANVAIQAKSLAPEIIFPQPDLARSGIVGLIQEGNLPGWTISVSTARGTFVTNVVTSAGGIFKVDLAPGPYLVESSYVPHPGPGQPLPNFVVKGTSKRTTVLRNQFRFVELSTSLGKVTTFTPAR
jgi:hypothetical protein